MANIRATVINFADSIFNSVAEVFESLSDRTYEFKDGIWLFDELLKITADSPTATICLQKIEAFLYAGGFANEDSAKFVVNPKQSANDLLAQMVKWESRFESYAWVVRQDYPSMKITSSYLMPIEKITKKTDGSYLVNPKRRNEQGYNKGHNVHYYAFDPNSTPTEFAQQLKDQWKKHKKQIGRILYIYDATPGQGEHYSIPGYYSGDSDIQADAEYGRLELFKVINDFQASLLIATGELDRQKELLETDKDGVATGDSAYDAFKKSLSKFTAKDPKQRKSILHLEAPTKEQYPEVQPLNTMQNAPDMNAKRFGISSAVARVMGVPGVLANLYQPGSLGDTKKIVDEINLLNSSLTPRKSRLRRAFDLVYPGIDWTIGTLNPIEFIPTEVWAKMTTDEIRKAGGLKPLSDIPKKELPLRDRLRLLSDDARAKALETLTDGEIREMAGEKAGEDDDTKESLNGEQLTGLLAIAEKIKMQQMTQAAGVQILKKAFGVSKLRATEMIASMVDESPVIFEPKKKKVDPAPSTPPDDATHN